MKSEELLNVLVVGIVLSFTLSSLFDEAFYGLLDFAVTQGWLMEWR